MRDAQLRDLGRAVARHLAGFTVQVISDYGDVVRLDHPDGRRLHLRRLWNNQGRVEISGAYPQSDYHLRAADHVSITVAVSRGPAVIATEINRRLLPAYAEVLGKVQAHLAQQAADHASRAQVAERLAALLPDASIHDDGRSATTVRWSASDGGPMGSGHVELRNGGTRATLEARLPAATVERLAAVLASLAPASAGAKQPGRTARRTGGR